MYYIVYETTNKLNFKIYVGVHETETPNEFDGYLGCGAFINKPSSYNKCKTHFHSALLKYGVNNFYRKTLKVFDNVEDALDLEAQIVNDDFVKRSDTYNMTAGGGIPPRHDKTIYQFDLQGNLIKIWKSVIQIKEWYDCNHDRIWMCIRDKRSFDDSYWSTEETINIEEYRLSARGYVYQYNKDGVLLNKFENATTAALKLDLDKQAIVNAVFSRTTYSGYYFLRADDDILNLFEERKSRVKLNVTPVYRYTADGNFNKEYESIADAVKDTPKANRPNIIRAIKNERTCAGYKWSYEKSEVIGKYVERTPVKIAQYDMDHNLIKIWDSVAACKKEFPSCQKVCRKERRSTNGYIFEYIS